MSGFERLFAALDRARSRVTCQNMNVCNIGQIFCFGAVNMVLREGGRGLS